MKHVWIMLKYHRTQLLDILNCNLQVNINVCNSIPYWDCQTFSWNASGCFMAFQDGWWIVKEWLLSLSVSKRGLYIFMSLLLFMFQLILLGVDMILHFVIKDLRFSSHNHTEAILVSSPLLSLTKIDRKVLHCFSIALFEIISLNVWVIVIYFYQSHCKTNY